MGIGIGAYVDEVFNDATNKMDNYYYGVRTFTNSGPTLEYLNDFYAETVGSLELLLGVTLSKFKDLGQVSDTTSLADISDAINTQGKFEGKQAFNATTNKPVYASGSNANSTWVDATGATAHTPV